MSDGEKVTKEGYFLEGVIDHFEEKTAVIITVDGQRINWPIKNLPEDCGKGQAIRLIFSTSKTEAEEREKIAKTILNEILKNTDKGDAR